MPKNKFMPKTNKIQTAKVIDENDQVIEASEVGVPGLFQPQRWDIEEELHNNEALREYQRHITEQNMGD
jgi:hypothetical protein